jgi:hypothetical protein
MSEGCHMITECISEIVPLGMQLKKIEPNNLYVDMVVMVAKI